MNRILKPSSPVGLLVLTLASTMAVSAQQTITCSSTARRPKICPANTRRGVLLLEERSDNVCEEGKTWSFNARSITTRGGCSAVFQLGGAAAGTTAAPNPDGSVNQSAPAYNNGSNGGYNNRQGNNGQGNNGQPGYGQPNNGQPNNGGYNNGQNNGANTANGQYPNGNNQNYPNGQNPNSGRYPNGNNQNYPASGQNYPNGSTSNGGQYPNGTYPNGTNSQNYPNGTNPNYPNNGQGYPNQNSPNNGSYPNGQPQNGNQNNGSQNSGNGQNGYPNSQQPATPARPAVLQAGTRMDVRLEQTLSPTSVTLGDFVAGTLVNDVTENGRVVIPSGTPVQAKVLSAQGAPLDVKLDSVTVNGQTYALASNSIHNARDAQNTGTRESGVGAVLGAIVTANQLSAGAVFTFRLTAPSRPVAVPQ